MLADLMPLMTDNVHHWLPPLRDLFGGKPTYNGHTEHRARVTLMPGVRLGEASRQNMPDAGATIWLFDHPRPIAIGDTFKLADSGETMTAIRVERRALAGAVLFKVYVK